MVMGWLGCVPERWHQRLLHCGAMRKTHTLTTKLLLMGLGFLLVAITSIGLTL